VPAPGPDPDDAGDDPAPDGGTYVLHVRLPESVAVAVGALGDRRLPAGAYGYVGSALGPGGFARVDRHREVATGERDVRHWHVDALLGHPDSRLADALVAPGTGVECAVATALRERIEADTRSAPDAPPDGADPPGSSPRTSTPTSTPAPAPSPVPVPGFGASDCDCPGHLVRERSVGALREAVVDAADAVGVAVERY
jgi:endonuclease-3